MNFWNACVKLSRLLFLGIFLNACAVAVPVHEAQPPHSLGKNIIRAGVFSAVNPTVIVDLSATGINESNLVENISLFGIDLGYGISERVDVNAEFILGFLSGSSTVLGLKYQYIGESLLKAKAGDFVGSARLRYVSSDGYKDDPNDSDNILDSEDIFFEKLGGNGYGLNHELGYHVANWFLVSLGLKYMLFKIDARFREGGSTGALFTDERSINLYGGHLGLYFMPRWPKGALIFGIENGLVFSDEDFIGDRDSVGTSAVSASFAFQIY